MSVSTSKEPAKIAGMFDLIARRYDTLNHLLSAGMDRRWRRRAIRELHLTGRERVLDVCTGTGDFAIEAMTSTHGRARDVVGVDFSAEMLRYAQPKIAGPALAARIHLARGDAMRLPLPDASVDAVTIGFGIRNVAEPVTALRDFHRVLRPGGSLAILEFGFPWIPGIKQAYRAYFKHVLPLVGRAISRHNDAYSYLPASVAEFPSNDAFVKLVRQAGFADIRAVPLSTGIVYLYVARKT
ncbi:MAG TPA: bifunctional demethylmenaquinone methyltransferase/2-methoxy-6-polyprenyl-1,4-benzoquinol methylase UbiE [Vicinamibacterales bacterium]|nr:bifunctional demethylmenaquinone methyltransferase/2-methoxy-6-polyprenyl-1,4-benzoquinol methylase UbiE [Vicinamibacterales bacterium]